MDRKMLKATVAFTAFIILVCGVYGLSRYLTIPSGGTISGLAANPPNIEWGIVDVDTPVSRIVTLTNNGDATISSLTMTTINPVGLTTFSCNWNLTGQSIDVDASKIANFTLTVSEYTTLDFSFDIIISGEP